MRTGRRAARTIDPPPPLVAVVRVDPPGEGKLYDDGGGKLGPPPLPPPLPPPTLRIEPGPFRSDATAASRLAECWDEKLVDRLAYDVPGEYGP